MKQSFFQKWMGRFRSAWHVLIGRAWAGYGSPMDWVHVGKENEDNLEPEERSIGLMDTFL